MIYHCSNYSFQTSNLQQLKSLHQQFLIIFINNNSFLVIIIVINDDYTANKININVYHNGIFCYFGERAGYHIKTI